MKRAEGGSWRRARMALILALGLVLLFASAASYAAPKPERTNAYVVRVLVSDMAGKAPALDPNLANGWGLAAGPTTPWWVADNHTDKSTVYDATGTVLPRVVSVVGGPSGVVYNGTAGFMVSAEGTSAPARFLFATEGGTILGWAPSVPASESTRAFVVADHSAAGAVYKGLAIGMADGKNYLYATDFHNGKVDVYDENYVLQNWSKAFTDRRVRKGFAPFGIQAIGDRLYVAYAKQDKQAHDNVSGRGLGYVDVYTMKGALIKRVATRGRLNAPWGIAMAPAKGFGRYNGCLLVGNFGDGSINAYRANKKGVWNPVGTLRTNKGKQLKIEGLWGIAFGNGGPSGPVNKLYFAAGPSEENHGYFGVVSAR